MGLGRPGQLSTGVRGRGEVGVLADLEESATWNAPIVDTGREYALRSVCHGSVSGCHYSEASQDSGKSAARFLGRLRDAE